MAGYPDGIGSRNAHGAHTPSALRRLLPLGVLGAVLVLAMTGLLGGTPNPVRRVSSADGTLEVAAPEILRNGEFIEIRFRLVAGAPIEDATLAIERTYLRDVTVNTMIPAADKEEAKDGAFRFSFGPLAAGKALDIKLDGQINPPLFLGNSGAISFADGERVIARLPMRLTVLP